MVLCTGRTPGDTPAQHSFRARSNTEPSRLVHALADCGLFPAVQSSKVGAHRHESDHFPLELQLLLTVPTLPTAPPPPPAPTPAWVWDNSQRGPYAHALLSGLCQALTAGCTAAASAHQHSLSATGGAHLEQADAQFRSATDTAAQAASLQCKPPGTGRQAPHLSCYPWWNPRCLMRQAQLRQAKLLWPRSPHVRLLEHWYQSHLRHSRSKFNQWTSPSCSKPTHASFGRQLAFQICCCPQSCMIQQLGTLSSANWQHLQPSVPLSCQLLTHHSHLPLRTASTSL